MSKEIQLCVKIIVILVDIWMFFYRCGVWNSGRELQVTRIVIQWKASPRTKMVGEHY